MSNLRETCRVVSGLATLVATLGTALALGGCAGLQTGGSSPASTTPAQKSATRPRTPSTPAAVPAGTPVSSASGEYAVTFGIRARTSRLGAVQFDARARGAGSWQGARAAVACRNISGAAMMACNNKGLGLLSCALIDPKGIGTPRDLVSCRFKSSKAVNAGDFTVRLTDASSPDMKPVGVSVVVTRVAGN